MEKNPYDKPVIVVDVGKVLVDFDLDVFFSKINKRYGVNISPTLSIDLEEIFLPVEMGKRSWQSITPILNNALNLSIGLSEWKDLFQSIFVGEISGMREALEELKKDFCLIGLSNTSEVHWPFILKNYPVLKLLDGWVLSFEVGLVKPDVKIYKEVEDHFNGGKKPFFYTDDVEHYVEAAKNLGWEAEVFIDAAHFLKHITERKGK